MTCSDQGGCVLIVVNSMRPRLSRISSATALSRAYTYLAQSGMALCKYKSDRVKPAGDHNPFEGIYKDTRMTDRRPSVSTCDRCMMNKNIPQPGAAYRLKWSSVQASISSIVDVLLHRPGLDRPRVLLLGYAHACFGQG